MARLGFVQADPIRAPARAQDLILRHRVADYRVGDLDRSYASLGIEEDYLYAYGFLSPDVWALVHPRASARLSAMEQRILEAIGKAGAVHPGELAGDFGRRRVVNAWGGYSQATKRALERLHFRGLLRIARREKGIRIYEAARPPAQPMPPAERMRKLVCVAANLLAPVPLRTLRAIASRLRTLVAGAGDHRAVLRDLFRTGELERAAFDQLNYVWPASPTMPDESPRWVRFLAPFDPLVWDRQRFEHLWQWPYRFEAYTPPARRRRGYYALPLLWCDRVIGWANANVAGQKLSIALGFVDRRPSGRDFAQELDAEIARLEKFLDLL